MAEPKEDWSVEGDSQVIIEENDPRPQLWTINEVYLKLFYTLWRFKQYSSATSLPLLPDTLLTESLKSLADTENSTFLQQVEFFGYVWEQFSVSLENSKD